MLDEDLGVAIAGALELNREDCRQYAQRFTWEKATQQFIGNLEPRLLTVHDPAPQPSPR
jgi:hypothetical protein